MNTPDTEWRESLWEWVEVAPSGAEVLNCYPESVVAIIEQALSSRDTYWKEGFKQMIQKQRQIKISDNKDITDGWNMALLNLLSTFDYPNAITNEDNLK